VKESIKCLDLLAVLELKVRDKFHPRRITSSRLQIIILSHDDEIIQLFFGYQVDALIHDSDEKSILVHLSHLTKIFLVRAIK